MTASGDGSVSWVIATPEDAQRIVDADSRPAATYRLEPTGRSEHEVREVLLSQACPTCGADWTKPGNGLPRGPSRSYLCTACQEIHPAQLVDEHGRSVASPGWGLTQELRRQNEGPDRHQR